MNEDSGRSVVRTYSSRPAAEFAKMLLESNGIASFISADDAGGMKLDLALATGVRLIVSGFDREKAESVLNESERQVNGEQDVD